MADQITEKKTTINCKKKVLDLEIPKVMGILNITPDSFFDGGKYHSPESIENRIQKMISEGMDILDIGAASSRPGSATVTEKEELERLKPVLELISVKFPELILSLDTFRAKIAEIAVNQYNVSIINDISAGNMDPNMHETIARLQVPYIVMHMQGTPTDMQQNPHYDSITEDILMFFAEKVDCLKKLGIHDLIIDPGFGFGKAIEHNYQLLKDLKEFNCFALPILIGLSRKSMIYKFFNSSPAESLNGTTVLNTIALLQGANILRVHDVKEGKETVQLVQKCMNDSKTDEYKY